MKPGRQPINDRVNMVEFLMSGPAVESYSHMINGERRLGANWSLRDAMSLVSSGHWIEIENNPDRPQTVMDNVW